MAPTDIANAPESKKAKRFLDFIYHLWGQKPPACGKVAAAIQRFIGKDGKVCSEFTSGKVLKRAVEMTEKLAFFDIRRLKAHFPDHCSPGGWVESRR
jgi:hypothetical protein